MFPVWTRKVNPGIYLALKRKVPKKEDSTGKDTYTYAYTYTFI